MICYNAFGVANPEGINEAPLRLPNCKHVFGDHCIKKWFEDADSCPYCRTKVPSEPIITASPAVFHHFLQTSRLDYPNMRDGFIRAYEQGTPRHFQPVERRSPPSESPESRRRTRARHGSFRSTANIGIPAAARPNSFAGPSTTPPAGQASPSLSAQSSSRERVSSPQTNAYWNSASAQAQRYRMLAMPNQLPGVGALPLYHHRWAPGSNHNHHVVPNGLPSIPTNYQSMRVESPGPHDSGPLANRALSEQPQNASNSGTAETSSLFGPTPAAASGQSVFAAITSTGQSSGPYVNNAQDWAGPTPPVPVDAHTNMSFPYVQAIRMPTLGSAEPQARLSAGQSSVVLPISVQAVAGHTGPVDW